MIKKGVNNMPEIRPISDLRNKFAEISKIVKESGEPVYLTKNGYGEMVVMSIEAYERKLFECEVLYKLKEAETEARSDSKRHSHTEVMSKLRARVAEKLDDNNE
jgi:prevent-host-death family protein